MTMNKKQGRGRPKFEGGVRIMLHLTAELVEAINEKTKSEKNKNPKIKRADVIRNALRAQLFPAGKRRGSDSKKELPKE